MIQISYCLFCLSSFSYSFCFITWFHFFRVTYRVSWWLLNHFSFNNQGLFPRHFNLAQCHPVKKIISAQYKFHNWGQVNLCTPNRSKKGKVLLEVARLEIHLQVNCLFIEHRIKADNDLFPLWDSHCKIVFVYWHIPSAS